jgi:ubiquinone/menaquinone biosynthesis C-methylase UbiE
MSAEAASTRGEVPSTPSKADYAMGSTDRERQRLMKQGAVLRGFTETALRAAGIAPGMRVLDIGAGVGDVSLLASDLVGAQGSVLGIDRDSANVAWASHRIAEAGRSNIRFLATEFADFSDPAPFDALVGPFIMMYLPDPAAALRRFAQLLRSGAKIAFFEPDLTVPSRCYPEIPLLNQCEKWFGVLRLSGARVWHKVRHICSRISSVYNVAA